MYKKWIKKLNSIRKKLLVIIHLSKRNSFNFNVEKQRIIICFDGLFSHGGIVDRLKGIISFYEIAKALDYDFYIHFKNPFELKHFLIPNKFNWEIDEKEMIYSFRSSKILFLMDDFTSNPLKILKQTKAKTIYVYSNRDYLPLLYSSNSENENNMIWRNNFNELFKTSYNLNQKLDLLPKENRIVIHTRFTSLMGDFNDTTSKILDIKSRDELIQKLISKIEKIASNFQDKKIYILSDSHFFLQYIQENTRFNLLSGLPQHIDVKKNDFTDKSGIYKTFTDFFFIVDSDEIFLLRLDDMYNSGFSKYASILGDKNFTLVQ